MTWVTFIYDACIESSFDGRCLLLASYLPSFVPQRLADVILLRS